MHAIIGSSNHNEKPQLDVQELKLLRQRGPKHVAITLMSGQKGRSGRTMENVVPSGPRVRERTQMEPPCFSIICLVTHRPSPFPVESLVVKNGSNIFGSAAALDTLAIIGD